MTYEATLSDAQRTFFDENGYLVIEDALDPDALDSLNRATDEVYERESDAGNLPEGKLNLRNCLVAHDAFLPLVDHPKTAPLVWQLLNWNVQLITSHLIVLPSAQEPSDVCF